MINNLFKQYGSTTESVYELITQARSNRQNLEGILDRDDMRKMKFWDFSSFSFRIV